ncbi:hypothetical protein SRL2020028_60860 [Mycobacterium kiyosense]|uniref:Uncharacterized protein n=1 Tax=Mycobacterium kiyosense TaxID=2871094 RepID=A0AA37PYU3_9MYCO|nr:hypothetical protein SRL2020028_60860 [Mycobacterium kiyosense]
MTAASMAAAGPTLPDVAATACDVNRTMMTFPPLVAPLEKDGNPEAGLLRGARPWARLIDADIDRWPRRTHVIHPKRCIY